jgi:hypothetical protein
MPTVARNIEDEQRAWRDYADRLRGLDGAEYAEAEEAAWEALQAALGEAAQVPATADGVVG